ncbi:MAG: hypothetical protein IJ589_08775 [Lachnospiraceae bacterium]|nr:hypothetical protein [Lachnospiraceae bacterium]
MNEPKTKKKSTDRKESRLFFLRRMIACLVSGILTPLILNMPVYAGAEYLDPINKLKTVAISIVAAAGVIVLIYGGVKFAESFQKKDQNGEYSAIYTIVAGGIMVGISAIITALT